ncbi:PREDICTED: polycystic kidney disease protein 1-like 2 [Branchiostoma belcheri]|uniref:Polycystic kidney disease protein 1-like 2 n=1 Tax=Branchiostoma belcheri TaxID=7741 RepID=A0A6P4YUB3_BRABE|nr:PREDICTED: polycystic kidney disease protein 1-like 2 [Branchiostoma belcheri]
MLANCRLSCDTCSTPPCHVTCTDSGDSLRYDCSCSGGWQGNLCNATVELTLEDVIDECASSPCTNGGVCLDRLNGSTDPLPISRMADFILHGKARLKACPDKSITGYSWSIFELMPHTSIYVSIYGLRNPITNQKDLTIPKQTLLPGTYMVQHTSDDFWVSAEESWDPEGLVSSSDLHITWTCETSDSSNVDLSKYICGKHRYYHEVTASQTAGSTINFTAQASSPGRPSIQASQVLVFQDNRACVLAIRCNNCDWSNTKSSEELVLEAVPGTDDTPLYEWTVVEHPWGFGGFLMSSSEPQLVIASNTFNVEGTYTLRVVNDNGVCSDGLAVSEWTFTVWGLEPPAPRNKNLSTPCVIERAGAGGCVCCGDFADGPGYSNVTYKFLRRTSVDVEKGWIRFPQDEPILQTPLPLTPYSTQVEVMTVDGRVAVLNVTEDIELDNVNGVIDFTSLLVMNTANLEKLSTNATNNKTASSAFNAIDNVLNMYDTLMPADGSGSASLEMSMLHAKIQREPCQDGQKKVFTVNDTLFVLPAFNTLDNSCEDSFGVELINSDFNPFRYSENSPDVGSEVAGLTVWQGRDRRPVHRLPEPVDMIIPREKQRTTSTVFKYTGQLRSSDDILVVKFRPQRTRTALTILLNITSTSQPKLDLPRVQLVWQRSSAPTADSFEAAKWTAVLPVPQDQLYTLQLPHMYNNTNLTSNPYSWLLPTEALNVTEFDIQNKTTFYLGTSLFTCTVSVKYAGEETSVTVRVSILESACVYFGEDSSHMWEDDGCKVGPLSNTTHLHCRCDHLTKFAGFVPPNPIYFPPSGSINFNENPIGLIAVLTVFGLFLLGYLMARKADRLDLTKVGVTTPTGHTLNPDPDCRYIITVYTGFRLDAGTTAQVSITVFGFRDESQPLALQDARRQLFQGGSVDSFLVSSEEPLGPLTHIHVWHDNTGPSPAWYLSKVVIQHLSSEQLDYFICNKWLALDEDDGRIDRMVFVASPEEMAAASNLISERAAKDFHDGHLWFSVVGRPARSGFTRAQRLACCMSTVYSTMLANIMFFGQGDNFDPPQPVRIMGVEIDPPISLPQIMIAIQSVIIVVPINALIVLLYRSAAPKASSKPVTKHANTKAGLLVFTVSFVAAFFTVLYTLTFGREKAEAWFTAFITSFVTDLILIQPVKVLTLAAILGLLIRKPTTDDDPPPTEVAGDEEYLQEVAEQSAADVAATAPLAGETLTRDRAQRVRRKRCRHILREMVVYGLFLSVLMLMSYTERSSLAFYMNNSIRSALEGTFSTISDPASYWTWLERDVLPAVHSPAWYNGRPCEGNLTLSEHLTHAISPLQLRQVRITQEQDCTIPDAMAHIAASCLDEYSASKLDTGSYDGNWGVAANYTNHDNSTDNRTIMSPWDYTYGDINNGHGGYIVALGRTLNDSLRTLTYLISNDWLDNRTRAVFTEAVLYNPHANLFAVVTMTTEFHITGRASVATELVIFRIHHEGQVLLLVLRMGLIIFLLFSLVKEVLKFNTYGMVYLTDPWSWLEMLIITTGMAAMGLYARAQGMTDEVSEYLKEGHVLFHLYRAAAMWHQVYTYLLGALTCFTLVKFIRLLKFNKHVNALLYTMKKTAKPLVSFFVISGIVFTAFALAANLTLGIAMSGYSSLLSTYTSLFNMMLGSFQFAILEESSPVWGPAIFLSFQFTAQFLLLSMFMTIIMDVYMEVKSSEPEDMEMMAYLWEEVCRVAHKIKTIANRPETRQPAARKDQFTQLDQMHEMLEKLDRDEKCRRERRREERQIEETQREERERMIRYSEAPSLWFV